MKRSVLCWLIGAVLLSGQLARAEVEQAAATKTPWSGYWWPVAKGELIRGPLTKYDQLSGKAAAQWEYQHKPPGPNVPYWHGYCHAWSAASVLENEPAASHEAAGGTGRELNLGVGDQKGLLSASHTTDVANTYGQRYQGPRDDLQDIYPDQLWRVLKMYIQQQGIPIVMDLEAGPEVWNYPVFAYRIEYSPTGAGGQQAGQLSLWAADDAVPPDHVGTKVLYHTYTFTFELRNGSIVMGSGRWTGNSVRNHPDFCWYPYVVRAENPEIAYATVKQLVGEGASPPANPPSGTNPPGGTPPGTTLPGTSPPGIAPGGNPPGIASPGTAPPGTAPPGTVPPGTVPPGTVPPGTAPPGTPGTNPPGGNPPGVATPNRPPAIVDPAGGPGGQQAVYLSPAELIALIAQKTSSFDFDVTVDRFDGGHYAVGENFLVHGASAQPGYLYLFYFNPAGNLWLLYPQPEQNNYVPAGRRIEVPGPNSAYVFQTVGPVGTARIKAVITSRPLVFSGLALQEQSSQQKGLTRVARREFQWWPSQANEVKELLAKYQEHQGLTSKDLDGVDPAKVLGPFAQDEVLIYVTSGGKNDRK